MESNIAEPDVARSGRAAEKTKTPMETTSLTNEEKATQDAKLKPEREAKFNDYIRIFTYARKWDFPLMVMGALAAIGTGVTMPLMNVIFGRLVGSFNSYFTPGAAQSRSDFEKIVNKQALYIFGLFIARWGLHYISKFSVRMIGIRMSAAIRLHYLRCLFGQTIHVLDSMTPGAAAGTITTTANSLQLGISEKLSTFIEFMSTIVASLIVAFITNWAVTLVTASVVLFILLTVAILLPFIIKAQSRQTEAETQSSAIASEAFGSIRMIAACGAETRMAKRFDVWADAAKRHGRRMSPLLAAQFGFVFFGMYAGFAIAFWYGTKSFAEGRLGGVGDIVTVVFSVLMMTIALERVSTPLVAISKAMVAACQFFVVIDAPKPQRGDRRGPDVSAASDIEFKGVDFAYPSRPHVKVLDGLDLKIEAGKLTAIVGPSGSGKSTVVGLVEKWYSLRDQHIIARAVEPKKEDAEKKKKEDAEKKNKEEKEKKNGEKDGEGASLPSSLAENAEDAGPPVELKGSISTAGCELDQIDTNWWRSQIGLVQQEPFLFNDTIYNNVGYGLIGSPLDGQSEERKSELIIEACKESFADEFIDRLPDGYNTIVGDGGAKLSGGQRQRISIARAVIKKPQVLILDEATSAIDVRGERIVQAALDRVSQGRTTITIAHRLSTIKKADTIVVLQKGRVVEQGTHDGLLKNEKGVYYGLVRAQQLSLGDPTDSSESDEPEGEDLAEILSREKSAASVDPSYVQHVPGAAASPLYIIAVIVSMCTAVASPLQAYLFAKIIVVFQYVLDMDKFLSESRFWSLMWTVLAIGVGFFNFLLFFITTWLAAHISSTYRKQYFENLLYQKIAFFDGEDNSTGTLTARVGSDPKQLEEMLGVNMAMVFNSVFMVIGCLVISYAYGWKLALVAMFVTMPLGIAAGYFRLRYELEFEKMNAAVFAESSKFAAEAIGAFRTVASMTLEETITTRYDKLLNGHVAKAYKKARWSTLIFALSDSLGLGCSALIFWYGGHLLASREYQAVNFFVCYMAAIQGGEGAGQGFSFGPNAAQASAAANRILSIRHTQEADAHGVAPAGTEKSRSIPDTEGGVKIELRDVYFKYPTRNVSIFKGLNITIEKGQFAALVGASGCGKTSIVSILERFYDPERGQVLANGVDIASLNIYEYRKHLSLVAQEPNIFQGTLRENILLGVDADAVTDSALHAACRDASIHDFIASLPDGYNTEVGSKGVSLSGGQKQRLSIARALIRRPDVLLLDEATSSLDSESEKLVQRAFERAASGRTMIVVAHRLATVQNADVIFVLGEGKVLEQGNHAELLRKKGVYWNMVSTTVPPFL
ncbi:ABC transporter BEA3 [Apiospora aurea]|uniref:ABC transporter BEA3 n=1 Tax=Apiospora aurea TaxID=335848 RepID=A0ABR1QAL7_9PEZI